MRRAARVDATQAEIVAALRAGGAYVWISGLPLDLIVGFQGKTALVECKTRIGLRKPRPAKYTALQTAFMRDWTGGTVATVTDAEGALRLLEVMRECAARASDPRG